MRKARRSILHVPKRVHDLFRGIDFPKLLEGDPLDMPIQQGDVRSVVVHCRAAEIKGRIGVLRHGVHGAVAIEVQRETTATGASAQLIGEHLRINKKFSFLHLLRHVRSELRMPERFGVIGRAVAKKRETVVIVAQM